MWHAVFSLPVPALEKVLRTVLVYALIVVLFRIAGKRGLAQFNTLDFVVMFLLSNIVQNAVIGQDNSFTGGAIGAVTLIVANNALDRLTVRSATLARILEGTPTTVIEDGHLVQRALTRLGIGRGDLEHAVRLQDGDSLHEVRRGVLEPGGQLVITLDEADQSADKRDVRAILARLEAIEAHLGDHGGAGSTTS